MTRVTRLLCAALALTALTGGAPKKPPPGGEDVSHDLDRLVEQALEEGLLDRPGEAARTAPKDEALKHEPIAAIETAPAGPIVSCADADALTFAGFENIRTYEDIYPFRQPSGDKALRADALKFAKALMALDLQAEARAALSAPQLEAASGLMHVARLLDGQGPVDLAAFTRLAECDASDTVWLALAALRTGDARGPDLMRQSLSAYRALPFRVRVRAAAIAIPALDARGEAGLIEKLLASFDEDETALCQELEFLNAVARLRKPSAGSDAIVRQYLFAGRFQRAAYTSLGRHQKALPPAWDGYVLEHMLLTTRGERGDGDVLELVTTRTDKPDFAALLRLSRAFEGRVPEAEAAVNTAMLSALEAALVSEDRLYTLEALNILMREAPPKGSPEQIEALYVQASDVARALRLEHFASALEGRAGQTAAPNPLDVAMNAIARKDAAAFAQAEKTLTLDAESLITLIESDAATGAWIVPDRLYNQAALLEGDAAKKRARAVLALRRKANAAPKADFPEYSEREAETLPDRIGRAREALAEIKGEGG